MKASGGCLCGAVRYQIDGDPIFSGHCHCIDCQKVTGETTTYAVTADSGQPYIRHFCPKCGSVVFGEPTSMAGVNTVPAGTLDDTSLFVPEMVVYTKSRPAWDHIDSGLPEFETMPPRG